MPSLDRPFSRLAVIGALVAALGLAACGRKGPLDPPPAASLDGQTQAAPQQSGLSSPLGGGPFAGQGSGARSSPEQAQGPKRKIPLDVLLN